VRAIFSKAKLGPQAGARPPVAVELSPPGVLAAASPGSPRTGFAPRGGSPESVHPPVYAFEPLPEGALVGGIGEPNLRAPEVVANAIRTALGQIAPRTRSVTLVVPDTVVRVFVLDFDSLPGRAAEAIPILRFRLRKMVPFDVEHAGVSYQILAETKTEYRVLAAVIPGPTLQEYESAVRQAGYEPGAVLPVSLAALGAIGSAEPALTANLSALALTTSITNGQDLLLYRTLDLPVDPGPRLEEVRRGISVAAAYYEDKLGVRPSLLYYAGSEAGNAVRGGSTAEDFARLLDSSDWAVVDLAPRPETGAATPLGSMVSLAGVAGALAGAA
jgi:type IV pilus assembly protein PilM